MNHAQLAARIRERRPLVHCLTNGVTIGRVADAVAAVGALPVMASAVEEAADMAAHAQALVLNLGTPTADRFVVAAQAGMRAHDRQVPIVVDPVGCGSTEWRTRQIRGLVRHVRPTVVRGNVPELAALAELPSPTPLHGVTAERLGASPADLARDVALCLEAVVVVTGVVDVVSDGHRLGERTADLPVLGGLVGAGDVLTAFIGVCCAVQPDDPFVAACAGLDLFGAAARLAAAQRHDPGSFWPRFMDRLANLCARSADAV
jgi:hydroxyethylthiazole kinase